MHIYAINNINFSGKNNVVLLKNIDMNAYNKIKKNINNNTKKDLYNNIDSFLNRKKTKKEFLANINAFAQKIDNRTKLNDAEKQYLDDMLTTIDLAGKSIKISEKYLIDNINQLLKNQS